MGSLLRTQSLVSGQLLPHLEGITLTSVISFFFFSKLIMPDNENINKK